MLKALSSYNPIGKSLLSLEHSGIDNTVSIVGIEIQLKKDELDIVQQFTVESVAALSDFAKNTQKTCLAITDENILIKEVNTTATDNEILSEGFPNLNLDDFYYQILKTNTKSFIAVCRKQYVDTIIAEYHKENIKITEVSLGNLKMAALSSYVQVEDIVSCTATVRIANEQVIAIHPKTDDVQETYNIEGLTVPNTHTLPLAMALDSFSHQAKTSGTIEEKNLELHNEFKESLFFKKALQLGIGFLLITLLINFFVFNAKYKKWQGLQEEIQVYTTQNESIKKQQTSVATKEAIVNSILTTGFSKSSFYIDQIIQSQPTTVILNSFTYQPITKTIRSDKPILLQNKVISITGNAIDKIDFTSWLNTVENLDFVATVTIINYGVDKKNTSSFEITINLADDTTK